MKNNSSLLHVVTASAPSLSLKFLEADGVRQAKRLIKGEQADAAEEIGNDAVHVGGGRMDGTATGND